MKLGLQTAASCVYAPPPGGAPSPGYARAQHLGDLRLARTQVVPISPRAAAPLRLHHITPTRPEPALGMLPALVVARDADAARTPGTLAPMIGEAAMLSRCLQGDPAAVRALVDELTPVLQARAGRAIFKRYAHRAQRRDLKQDVEELTQEVFAMLFANDAATLRSWDESKGLSLRNFVGMIADREIAKILKSGRRRPWTEERTVEADDERHAGASGGPETPLAAREMVVRVLDKLREELSAQGFRLFELILIDEKTVEEVCTETGLSRDAVYAWRSRLPKLVRRCAEEILP